MKRQGNSSAISFSSEASCFCSWLLSLRNDGFKKCVCTASRAADSQAFGFGFALPEKTGTRSLFCCATGYTLVRHKVSFLSVYACSLFCRSRERARSSYPRKCEIAFRAVCVALKHNLRYTFRILFVIFVFGFSHSQAFLIIKYSAYRSRFCLRFLFRSAAMSHLVVRRRQRANRMLRTLGTRLVAESESVREHICRTSGFFLARKRGSIFVVCVRSMLHLKLHGVK